MTNKFKEFINAMGALTEVWTLVYKNFIKQGYSVPDALTHTREFTAALMIATMAQGGKNTEENKGETT